MTEHIITLSTTEPNNYVGLLKMRQGDIASQSIQTIITANGQLFNFDHLAVFFNAVLPNGNVVRDKVTEVDYVNSKLNYIVADSFLQEVAQVTAWFSFENDEKIIDSTKNFQYSVIGGWKECIPQGNYIYELSEIQREIEEIIGNKDFSSLINKIDLLKTDFDYLDDTKASKVEMDTKASKQDLASAITSQDDKIANIVNGTPKGVYASLAALKSAFPNGTAGIYVTSDNGHWYYWNNGWIDGGIYQATAIQDDSLSYKKLKAGGRKGSIAANKLVIDFKNKKISVTSDAFVLDGITNFKIVSGAEFTIARNNGYLVYNKVSKVLDLVDIGGAFNSSLDENIYLGVAWVGEMVSVDNPLITNVLHTNGKTEVYKNNILKEPYETGVLINDFKFLNVFQVDYTNKVLKLKKEDDALPWYVQSEKSPVRYPIQQTEVKILTDETPQVLYYDYNDSTLKFIGHSQYLNVSDNTIYLGRIAYNLQKHYLNILTNNGSLDNLIKGYEGFSYDGSVVNAYNRLKPIIDFENKVITFPRLGTDNGWNWIIYKQNNYASFQLVDSFKNEKGDVVVPILDTAFQFLVLDQEKLEIKCISNTDAVAGNYNYIKLGVIMPYSKTSFLNFELDNTELFNIIDGNGGNHSEDFEKNNIIIFGDSLSTFKDAPENTSNYPAFYPNGDVDDISKTWWKPIFDKYGNQCFNAAFSGGCLTNVISDRKTGIEILDETTLSTSPNILLFEYGTNDYGRGVSSSSFNADLETFVSKAREKWPAVIIYVLSYPFNERMYKDLNLNQETVEDWTNAVISKAKTLDCKTVNITHVGNSESNWNLFNIGDGIHFNVKGAKLIKNNVIQQVAEFN
ncbi:SGNH/GDSL hydrolase family protein [Lactococcus lactis]|uniref:SGNH/GDSL hydrolase family protein n=1 Tax=Lactococcus lactis TaxID=1358 RepID=UPI002072E756|nr:SGNH/GDSL hydrolase family protein [Lactococcus lactis]